MRKDGEAFGRGNNLPRSRGLPKSRRTLAAQPVENGAARDWPRICNRNRVTALAPLASIFATLSSALLESAPVAQAGDETEVEAADATPFTAVFENLLQTGETETARPQAGLTERQGEDASVDGKPAASAEKKPSGMPKAAPPPVWMGNMTDTERQGEDASVDGRPAASAEKKPSGMPKAAPPPVWMGNMADTNRVPPADETPKVAASGTEASEGTPNPDPDPDPAQLAPGPAPIDEETVAGAPTLSPRLISRAHDTEPRPSGSGHAYSNASPASENRCPPGRDVSGHRIDSQPPGNSQAGDAEQKQSAGWVANPAAGDDGAGNSASQPVAVPVPAPKVPIPDSCGPVGGDREKLKAQAGKTGKKALEAQAAAGSLSPPPAPPDRSAGIAPVMPETLSRIPLAAPAATEPAGAPVADATPSAERRTTGGEGSATAAPRAAATELAFQARLVPVEPLAPEQGGRSQAPDLTAPPPSTGSSEAKPGNPPAIETEASRPGRSKPVTRDGVEPVPSQTQAESAPRGSDLAVSREAPPQTAAPKPGAPPARSDPARLAEPPLASQTAETKPAAVKDIRFEVNGPDRRVEIRLTESAGEVRVAVRTPDSRLAADLRENLSLLSSRLEQAGFRAEAMPSEPGAGDSSRKYDLKQAPEGQMNDRGQGSRERGGSGDGRQQQRHPEVPEELTRSKSKRKDFAWLLSTQH